MSKNGFKSKSKIALQYKIFERLFEANVLIERWCKKYNTVFAHNLTWILVNRSRDGIIDTAISHYVPMGGIKVS